MVPSRSAQSSAVRAASPWLPISTTSSPIRGTGPSASLRPSAGPQSTISWSMVTAPTTRRRRPPTSSAPPTSDHRRDTPSA
jgi:hypothetical protein